MRICIVSKFPPIEGGIAARTYWRVRRLLEEGHRVAVVTNASCVEADYRIQGCDAHLSWLQEECGLVLRNVPGPVPWHVPDSPAYLERLVNELLFVLRAEEWDVLESDYLVPFGIAGHFASASCGIPHVVRHGGSDLAKFLDHPGFGVLLRDVFAHAHEVITDCQAEPRLRALGARTRIAPVYEPNQAVFNAQGRNKTAGACPVYAFIGKVNYKWWHKGLDLIARWYASQRDGSVRLRLIGQGRGVQNFMEWARRELGVNLTFEPFVPPWEIPAVLKEIDHVFALNVDDPIPSWSMIAAEAEASGCHVIRDVRWFNEGASGG